MFIKAYKKAWGVITKKPMVLWGLSLMSMLLTGLAYMFCGAIPALAVAVCYVISAGMTKVYLDGLKGLDVRSEQLFAGFGKNAGRIAGALAWRDLWILIWGLIPFAGPVFAVIKSYSYRFVPYIVMTKPEVKATEALKLSMKMTEGKRGQMFLADLCYYGAIAAIYFVLWIPSGMTNIIALAARSYAMFEVAAVISVLTGIVATIFSIVVVAFSGIFTGLYQASFFEEDTATVKE